jgi:hypothetical protein
LRFRLLLAVAFFGTFAARRAAACEPMPCQRSYVLPEAGSVPANAAGIVAFVNAPSGSAPLVAPKDSVVTARAKKSPGGFDSFLIAPKGGFVAGTTREVEVTSPCTYIPPAKIVAKLKITAAAPAPTALGTLIAEPPKKGKLKVGTSAGSCSISEDAAWVDVTVQLHPSAEPWVDLLEYATFVDGKLWQASDSISTEAPPGASWVGHGRDRVYVLCPGKVGFPGTTDGEHEIVMRARVNDGPELSTPALKLRISCGDTSPERPGTDPGPPPKETPDPVVRPMNRSRCSCESVGAEREFPLGALALALTLGVFATRRRR